jgi:hypothetical protein
MTNEAIIAGMLILAANTEAGEDYFNPKDMTPGSVVRIAARRPAINLGRAEVVDCTTNLLTVRHNKDKFTVVPSNVLEMVMIERAPGGAAGEAGVETGADGQREGAEPAQAKRSVWEWIKALFRGGAAGK